MADLDIDDSEAGGHKKGHSERPRPLSEHRKLLQTSGSSGWTRTSNPPVNSRMLAALRRKKRKKQEQKQKKKG